MICRAMIFAMLMTTAVVAKAQDLSREPKIKAAYLFNFGKYVEWPSAVFGQGQNAPLVIGVVGPSAVPQHLSAYSRSGKTVQGRPIQIAQWNEPQAVGNCHILFVSHQLDSEQRQAVLSAMDGKPVLLVADEDVGGVRFVLDQNRMRLQIAASRVRARGLKVSSKLLQVAEVID